jgi:hypothetical protein
MFIDVGMCEFIVCMKGKPIKKEWQKATKPFFNIMFAILVVALVYSIKSV